MDVWGGDDGVTAYEAMWWLEGWHGDVWLVEEELEQALGPGANGLYESGGQRGVVTVADRAEEIALA